MEQRNGHFNVMETRIQCGGLRYKSKVPRARGAPLQLPEYADCTLPTALKRDNLPSPRDHHPSPKDYQSNRNHLSFQKDYHPSPRDQSPSQRSHHSLPRDHHFSPKDYHTPPRDHNPSLRDHSPSPRNHYSLIRDSHSLPRERNHLPRDYNPQSRDLNPQSRDLNPQSRDLNLQSRDLNPSPRGDHFSSLRDYNPSPRDHQGMLGLGDTDEQKEWRQMVGQRVCISGVKQGTLRYFGRTKFAQGHWCGVELDEPVGKHDGTVGGVVYFACRPNHGIFAPVGKVSKLNDTWDSDETSKPSNLSSTWRAESARQELSSHVQQRHSGWEYSMEEDSLEKKYIRNSISEPVFMQGNTKPTMPRGSESFSFERRGPSKNSAKQSSAVKISSSSRSISKYGYAKKNQYLNSNVITLSDNTREIQQHQLGSGQNSGLTAALEEYEQFLRTPTNSGQASPMSSETTVAKRFNEMPFYDYGKMPDAFLNAFQSHDFSDFEDEVDNDDQMSVDYDESLGILTPSQMKDLTLGTDFPTSLSDIRGLDFPSSESFDDINDLPEDEQVHDVSVFRVSEPSATRSMEISKQNNSITYNQNFKVAEEEKIHVSSTNKFLSSISKQDHESFSTKIRNEPHFVSTAPDEFNFNSTDSYKRTCNVDEFTATNITCPDSAIDVDKINSDKYKIFSKGKSSNPCLIKKSSELPTSVTSTSCSVVGHTLMEVDPTALFHGESGPIEMVNGEEKSRQNNESFLSAESENNTTLKEKLTVSWEDCLSRDSEVIFPQVERPESVYTVGSSDTGYQEDGELEGDPGMTTSMDSTDETKRFSLASRDSCIVSDEADVYKIAESNSTSGYSTGLSDSCCNDRAEDDLSSKPLTDEEIQDSVEHCDSEDAFSFQENSLGKDGDMMNMETSEVTTENVTAVVNNDSTSDALCETMVEDSTLTEINELLMSPEDNGQTPKSPTEAKETEVITDPVSEVKSQEKIDSSIVTNSQSQSTPERKSNSIRTRAAASTRNTSTSGAIRASRASKEEDIDKRRQQAVVPKSPKKNVMSKIKAMIEATSCKSAGRSSSSTKTETEQPVVTRRTVSAPKKSRWEAVTSKIAASLAEEKTKPKTKREIRSRVDTNLTTARQQQVACKSPKLDSCRASNCGEGSMSPPVSVCSRDRRSLADKNSAQSSVREGRVNLSRDSKQRPKSPRQLHRLLSLMAGCAPVCRMTYVIATPPGPGRLTSRSASPVAASESSTASVSLNSHNSKSKIAHWKGSNSTIASSVPPPPPITKRPPPLASTKATSVGRAAPGGRPINKKPPTVPKIRITPSERSQSPVVTSRNDKSRRHSRTTKEHGGVGRAGTHLTSKQPVRPPMWLSKAELTQEIQRLGTLCEARTKELNRLKMETKHVTVGFDAFAALFKYMVDDVKGLSVPQLSEELKKTLKQLELAKQDLAYYEREVEEMKAHHCQELNDLSNKLFEVFQGEVTELGTKHQEEINRMKIEHEQQLKATSETYEAGYEESQASHEAALMKLKQELITQREELQLFHEKELVELEEKHSQSTKTLQEHIEQLQKKCAELKHHSLGMEDAMRKDTDTKLQWVTSRKGDLEKEVESLKAVLEMKNKELHTLRVQNLEMEKQLEELPLAREKIKMLSARAEDLEALMIEKTRVERKLSTENQTIRDTYEKESKVNKRLSMENEELQWRLRQAEQSIISGSFTDVAESAEETENGALSPAKSPHQMSRSVFFTFVDKDNASSPRSQYKKIAPGFSSGYKTSPSKSSRNRGLSEPMQPSSVSTPKKGVKTSLKQKRQRASTNVDNGGSQSLASSMVSSVGSECSVFDQKEGFLEEHQEQIIESLEILREQRCSEETDELSDNRQNGEILTDAIAMHQEQNGEHLLEEPLVGVSRQKEYEEGLVEQYDKSLALDCEKMRFSETSSDILSEPMTPNDLEAVSYQKELSGGLVEQHGKLLGLGSDKIGFSESSPETGSEPITPSDKWHEEVARNGGFDGDEMSRSAEFSDPKTYYHMTFPVLKEAGAAECDGEDSNKTAGQDCTTAQAIHSMVESRDKVDSHVVQVSKEVSSEVTILSLVGNGASTVTENITQENALVQSCHSTQELECNLQSREKNRWRTM